MNLLNKQGFSLFYGNLKNKYIKKKIKIIKMKKITTNLFQLVESRLDTVLYRSHFTKSVREARFLIKQGHISVNYRKIVDNNFKTTKGDILITSYKIRDIVVNNVLSSNMWPVPPDNLIINYKIFSICIVDLIRLNNLFNKFPFYFSTWKLINYY